MICKDWDLNDQIYQFISQCVAKNSDLSTLSLTFNNLVFMASYLTSIKSNNLLFFTIHLTYDCKFTRLLEVRVSFETLIKNLIHLESLRTWGSGLKQFFSYKFFKTLIMKDLPPLRLCGITVSYKPSDRTDHKPKSSQKLAASIWLNFKEDTFSVSYFCDSKSSGIYIDLTMLLKLFHHSASQPSRSETEKIPDVIISKCRQICYS